MYSLPWIQKEICIERKSNTLAITFWRWALLFLILNNAKNFREVKRSSWKWLSSVIPTSVDVKQKQYRSTHISCLDVTKYFTTKENWQAYHFSLCIYLFHVHLHALSVSVFKVTVSLCGYWTLFFAIYAIGFCFKGFKTGVTLYILHALICVGV